MDGKLDSAVHVGDDDGISLGKREQLARQNVAGAEAYRSGRCQQDVSSTDSDAHLAAWLCSNQGGLELNLRRLEPCRSDATSHGAAVFVNGNDLRVKNILKSGKLSDGFTLRCGHDVVRRTLRDELPLLQHQQPFAEHEHFVAAVSYVENGNGQILNGPPEVVGDFHPD